MGDQTVIIEKTKELLSGHCCEGLREAARNWLNALGTENESAAVETYKAVLDDSIMPIDAVIELFSSDVMKDKIPAEMIKAIHDHAVESKASGAEWCDCPACTKAQEIRALLS